MNSVPDYWRNQHTTLDATRAKAKNIFVCQKCGTSFAGRKGSKQCKACSYTPPLERTESPRPPLSNPKRATTEMDAVIGENLRRIRTARQLTQEDLARAMGLTFQQIQKYEKGTNRISLSRAVELADLLDVKVADFLNGVEPGSLSTPLPIPEVRLSIEEIANPKHRAAVMRLAKALAEVDE